MCLNCINKGDFDKFKMLIDPLKDEEVESIDILRRTVRTILNESLLHLATVRYVEHQDARFMRYLLELGFSPIDEDSSGDVPPFALSLCDSDEDFINGLKLFIEHDYSLNHETSTG